MSFYENGSGSSGGGAIWSNGAFSFESPLKDLLDSGNYTLHDLLGEDELLQELRGLHPQLIDFFTSEESVAGLLKCLLVSPPDCLDHMSQSNTFSSGDENLAAEGNAKDISKDDSHLAPDNEHAQDGTGNATNEICETDDDKEHNGVTQTDDAQENEDDCGSHDEIQNNDDLNSDSAETSTPIEETKASWLYDNITETNDDRKPLSESRKNEYENTYIRYPYMACEVICCEIDGILDILVEGTVPDENDMSSILVENIDECEIDSVTGGKKNSMLDLLFSLLTSTEPSKLDDRRAGYFEKILSVLFRRKPVSMASYINGNDLLCSVDTCKNENSELCDQLSTCGKGDVPILKSFFKHLHSHSIMQIVQRLLMPHPHSISNGTNLQGSENDSSDQDDDANENQDDDAFNLNNGAGLGLIHCNWAENDLALKLLVSLLIGKPNSIEGSIQLDIEITDDAIFDYSQHASEILITMIQNSQLTSVTISSLSSDPILHKIIESAGYLNLINGDSVDDELLQNFNFSRHDSLMTNSMSVLESLVLQLGGYGAVPTSNGNSTAMEEDNSSDTENLTANDINSNECNDPEKEKVQNSNLSEAQGSVPPSQRTEQANVYTLKKYLPNLLKSLSHLLRHPNTITWKTPVQYSSQPNIMLGTSRLRIVRLLESLVLLGNKDVDHILCQSNALEICLELFWEFAWCSMLHQSVANLLVHVLEGGEDRLELQHYFLNHCDLPHMLMNSFSITNEGKQKFPVGDKEQGSIYKSLPTNTSKGDKSSCETQQISDMMIALKAYKMESATSSVETEHGSSSFSEDGLGFDNLGLDYNDCDVQDIIPVSDDDVDVALEQEEELDNNPKQAEDELSSNSKSKNCEKENNLVQGTVEGEDSTIVSSDADIDADATTNNNLSAKSSKQGVNEPYFRMGYMGHVIIICQALVHACGNSSDENDQQLGDLVDDDLDLEIGSRGSEDLSVDSDVSRKRKGHPPTSASDDEDDDISQKEREELSKSCSLPQSPEHGKHNDDVNDKSAREVEKGTNILELFQTHPLFNIWQTFANSTLASETNIQSTPLGGYNENDTNPTTHNSPLHDDTGVYLGDDNVNSNPNLGGEAIDIEDPDLVDVAASMMKALSTDETNSAHVSNDPFCREEDENIEQMGNECEGSRFGTIVEMNTVSGEYLYDDPLGGGQRFDNEESDNESLDDEDVMGLSTKEDIHNQNYQKENDDDDVPVMDLFAGNFNFEDSGQTIPQENGESSNDDWANFANFDDTFGASNGITDPVDFGSPFDEDDVGTDFFTNSNGPDFVGDTNKDFDAGDSVSNKDLFAKSEHKDEDILDLDINEDIRDTTSTNTQSHIAQVKQLDVSNEVLSK